MKDIVYRLKIRQKVRAGRDHLQACRRDVGERRPYGHPYHGPAPQRNTGGIFNNMMELLGLVHTVSFYLVEDIKSSKLEN